MARHSRFNLFIIGLATAAITVLQLAVVQRQTQTRFLVVLLEAALGVPCLVVLAVRTPVAVAAPPTSSAHGSARSRRKPEVAATSPLAQPGRTQLGARLGLAFLVTGIIAALLSGRIGLSIFGLQDWANGAVLIAALVGMWAIGVGLGEQSASLLERCLLFAVLVNASTALYQGVTGNGLIAGRAAGLLDNPVFLAPLLIGGLWLAIRRVHSNAVLWGFAVVVLAAAVQTSGSRSALLLFPVLLVGAARLEPKRVVAVAALCLIGGLAAGGVAARIGEESSSSARTVSSISADTLTTRIEVWSMATHAILDRPLLGAGPGRFLAATGKYTTLKLTKAEGLDSQFVDAHNLLVEYAVTSGLIGLALLVTFLVVALSLSGWQSPLAGFAILALAMHLVEPQHGFVTPIVFLALGAAATGKAAVSWKGTTPAHVILVAVACEQALLIALGSRTVADLNSSIRANELASAAGRLESAAWQTPFWAAPVSLQADVDESRANAGEPGAVADAVRDRRHATEREPERMLYWAELGIDEQAAGDVAAARAAFQQALAVNPWAADVQVRYAKFLIDQGDTAEAKRQLEHAVLALPDRTEADQLLSQLP